MLLADTPASNDWKTLLILPRYLVHGYVLPRYPALKNSILIRLFIVQLQTLIALSRHLYAC